MSSLMVYFEMRVMRAAGLKKRWRVARKGSFGMTVIFGWRVMPSARNKMKMTVKMMRGLGLWRFLG